MPNAKLIAAAMKMDFLNMRRTLSGHCYERMTAK
jgi:hypothetical protein